jgi:hypothetical protein
MSRSPREALVLRFLNTVTDFSLIFRAEASPSLVGCGVYPRPFRPSGGCETRPYEGGRACQNMRPYLRHGPLSICDQAVRFQAVSRHDGHGERNAWPVFLGVIWCAPHPRLRLRSPRLRCSMSFRISIAPASDTRSIRNPASWSVLSEVLALYHVQVAITSMSSVSAMSLA